jgi:hypothetical protein
MPSRRAFLQSGAVTASGVVAGCTAFDRGVDGYVQLKILEGRWSENGVTQTETILDVRLGSPGEGRPELKTLGDEWADRFETPREPVVSDTLHDDLRQAYESVAYGVGVCSPNWGDGDERQGCRNGWTTRESFNTAQVHDRVSASSDASGISIHAVDGTWEFSSG